MVIMTVSKTVVLCSSQSRRANGSLVKRISHNATDVGLKVRILQGLQLYVKTYKNAKNKELYLITYKIRSSGRVV